MKTHAAIAAALAWAAVSSSAATPDSIVDPILESAASARFLVVGEGPLAEALRRRAPGVAPGLAVLPLRGAPDAEAVRERAAAEAPTKRVADAAELGPVPFLVAWLGDGPDSAASAFALADAPAAAALAPGFDAVPSGAVWRVVKAGTVPSEDDVLAFDDERDRVGESLAAEAGGDALETAVRRHFSRLGNDLGRRLALAGDSAGAREAFRSAAAILPGAPSAILNQASLERSAAEADPAARARIAGMLQGLRPSGGILAMDGGVLLRPEDFFDAGWFWTLSGLPASDTNATARAFAALPASADREALAGLVKLSLALQRGNGVAETSFLVNRVGSAGLTPELRLAAAETIMSATGDSGRAAALLERFAVPGGGGIPADEKASGGDSLPFWLRAAAAAAGIRARRGETAKGAELRAAVEKALASDPASRARARAFAFAPADVESGRWAAAAEDFAAGPEGPEAPLAKAAAALARADAAAAAAALDPLFRPGAAAGPTWPALRMRLEAAFGLGDREGADSAADALLALRPRDAFANWIKGSLAMARGDKAAAARHLQASTAERPTWYALNDLASLQAESGNPAQAESLARMALDAGGPDVPALHDTLGEALAAQGKHAEAAAAFRAALAAARRTGRKPDSRTHLHLAEELAATGDAPGAAEQIAEVDKDKDGLSVRERERLGAVRRAVAAALDGGK